MNRIDTINARENMFGVGKSGFHDNADLPGQDATYVSPKWFNTVQEELCNLLELRGITLDPASKRQLYDLLTTQADLEALADEIETNFIRKNQIADDLTTNDATKVTSAKQVKILQDNKLDKTDLKDASTTQKGIVQLNNTLTSTSTTQAATAAQVKILNDKALGIHGQPKNVTASRIFDTEYVNTDPYPRQVYISCSTGPNADNIIVKLDDEAIFKELDFGTSVAWVGAIFFIVRPGGVYKITSNYQSTPGVIRYWSEV